LIGSKASEQMNAFLSDSKYIEDSNISRTITVTKCETILHCTMDQALLSYFSNDMLLNSEPNCARFRTSNYIEYEDLVKIYKEKDNSEQISKYKRDLCISSLDFALPFPFNPRTSNRSDSTHYDPSTKTFFMVGKNFLQEGEDEFCVPLNVEMCKKRNTEPITMKAYRFFLFNGRMYQQIDEKNILFKDIAMLDFGGWASSKPMTKFLIEDRKNKYKDSIVKMAKLIPDDKKISDYKVNLTRKVDGKVVDGFGTLLSNQFSMEREIKEVERIVSPQENIVEKNLKKIKNEEIQVIETIEEIVKNLENFAPQDNFEVENFVQDSIEEEKNSKTQEILENVLENILPQVINPEIITKTQEVPIEKNENIQLVEVNTEESIFDEINLKKIETVQVVEPKESVDSIQVLEII
jgi:hypothetical protein